MRTLNMEYFNFLESKKIVVFTLILIFIYTVFIFLYPLLWARTFFKTQPPQDIGRQIIHKNIPNSEIKNPLKAVVIGDSTALGQGTDSVLDSFSYQYLNNFTDLSSVEYTNFAVSGNRVDQVLENQLALIPSAVDLIFVSIGANDVTALIFKKTFELKVNQLAQKLSEFNAQIIWLNIPDFVTVPTLLQPLNYFLSQRAKTFNVSIKKAADDKNFILVNIFDGTRQKFAKNPKAMFARDNYHPSKEGYKLWSEVINNKTKI